MERKADVGRMSSTEVTIESRFYLTYKYYLEDLFSAFSKYAGGKLLDIGCGNKPFSKILENQIDTYIGCDIVQSSLNIVDVICAANQIPLPSSDFDTVISTQTIEHVEDHKGLVDEAYRLLKPGGYFIVSGPQYWPLHEEPYDFFRFTKYGFEYILKTAGFEIVEHKANGGKWALCGQVILQTIYPEIFRAKGIRAKILRAGFRILGGIKSVNRLFSFLDARFYDDSNTTNYIFIARKSAF